MCNFRSIPWYCRYVVIGHNSNFGKDLIFTNVMTQTHFKLDQLDSLLRWWLWELRRLLWSQIHTCFYMKKSYIFWQKTRVPTKKIYLWTLSSRFRTKVLFHVNHDQVNFLKDVLLWQDQIQQHTGDDRHIVVENSNFLWIRFNG